MHLRPSNDRLYATERFHRLFIVLFAPAYAIFLPFIFTAATSWAARNHSPRRLWRPLTILSLSAATVSAAGVLVFQATRGSDAGQLLKAWASSYLVFCAVLLPHSLARVLVLQRARHATRRPER